MAASTMPPFCCTKNKIFCIIMPDTKTGGVMKKLSVYLLWTAVFASLSMQPLFAEEITIHVTQEPSKAEQIIDGISTKAETGAKNTAAHVKSGSKKAGIYIKDKSAKAARKTGEAMKTGGKKAKAATCKAAQKTKRATAKGLKKSAIKIEKAADRAIENSNQKLNPSTEIQNAEVIENSSVAE